MSDRETGRASQPERLGTALPECRQSQSMCFAGVSQSAAALGVGLGSLAHRAGSAVACGSAWQTVVFVAPVVHSRCGHPLHGPSGLHKAAFQKVPGSRCAKASLGAPHRCAPSRVSKTGLMQSGLHWVRSHSRLRSPVAGAPYAPPSARPRGWRGTWALVRRCALRYSHWPTANHVVSAPAHPCASPLRGTSPTRWTARPPPRGGSLSPRENRGGGRVALTRRHELFLHRHQA